MSTTFNPYILAPPLTYCDNATLVFGRGEAPYRIYIIESGSDGADTLEYLPNQDDSGAFSWRVDLSPGQNITFVIQDSQDRTGYSSSLAISPGSVETCPRNNYDNTSESSGTSPGAIAGAVIGALVACSLLGVGIWLFLRHRRRRQQHAHSGSDDPDMAAHLHSRVPPMLHKQSSTSGTVRDEQTRPHPDDVPLNDSEADLHRAGTFNLSGIDFTEESIDRLRELDRPPPYRPPRPNATARSGRPSS